MFKDFFNIYFAEDHMWTIVTIEHLMQCFAVTIEY